MRKVIHWNNDAKLNSETHKKILFCWPFLPILVSKSSKSTSEASKKVKKIKLGFKACRILHPVQNFVENGKKKIPKK